MRVAAFVVAIGVVAAWAFGPGRAVAQDEGGVVRIPDPGEVPAGFRRQDQASLDRGSWDPVDRGGARGGRVRTTAMFCLALETPFRYGRVPTFKK